MSGNAVHSHLPASVHGKNEETHHRDASDDQKLFIVLSVATATACFLVNTMVVVAVLCRRLRPSCRPRTLRSPSDHRLTTDALHLSQAVAGILASAASVYPIEVIAIQRGHGANGHDSDSAEHSTQQTGDPPLVLPDVNFFTSPTICYVLASAPLLASVFAALGTNTMMALEQHLLTPTLRPQLSRDARRLSCPFHCRALLVSVGLAAVWLGTLTTAILPIIGPGSRWLGFCILPGVWTDVFTAVVAILLLLLILLPVYLYAGIFLKHRSATPSMRSSNARIDIRGCGSEEVPICEPPISQCSDVDDYPPIVCVMPSFQRAKANFIHFCLLLICYLPVALHLLSWVGIQDTSPGVEGIAALLERDSTLPWAALLVVVAGAASPVVYLLVDDELPGLTVDFARSPTCECCWSMKKNVSHKPVSMDSDDDDVEDN